MVSLPKRAGLVEIGVLEQQEVGVDVLDLTLDDAGNGEVPGVAAALLAEDVALNGNAVADFPAPFLRQFFADHSAAAVTHEGLKLLGRNVEFAAVHVEIGIRLDCERHDEVLRVLIIAPEPVGERHLPDTFDRAHAIEVGDWHRLGEVDLVDGDHPIRGGAVLADGEGAVKSGEHAEDHEGDQDRHDHQARAQFAAEQVFPDQVEVVHAASSRSTKRPLSRCRTRLE